MIKRRSFEQGFIIVLALFLSVSVFAQASVQDSTSEGLPGRSGSRSILYDNGPLITTYGGGAGGADISEVQTALGMTTMGVGCQVSLGNRMADDFVVTEAWRVQSVTLYTYQSNSTTISPITDARIQIWDGPPNSGGSVIWGDLTTNRLEWTNWSNIYRVSDTTQTATDRPIMLVGCTVSVDLEPGTYWLDWQFDGDSGLSGPWQPPITILGSTTTGNALKYSTDWAEYVDTGIMTQQGLPFVINGVLAIGELIDFDDLATHEPIGTHYSGLTFSPGWEAWETVNPHFPAHSSPNVAYTHEDDNSITWDCDVNYLGFYASCNDVSSSTFTYSVYDNAGMLLNSRNITASVLNELIEFYTPGIRRLKVTGTGEWSGLHTMDDLRYQCSEYLECPLASVFSQPVDANNPYLNGFSSDPDNGYTTADRYIISAGNTIQAVRWWGFSFDNPQTAFTIKFSPNTFDEPGTPVSVYNVTATFIDTGYELLNSPLLQFDAELPAVETQTNGWISVIAESGVDSFYWASTTLGDEVAVQELGAGWDMTYNNMSFCLIPQPTTPTPTQTPTCTTMGCTVVMPSTDFGESEDCYCDVYVCNTESVTYTDIPVFVILDVYGMYFFAPSFGSFDFYDDPIPPGMTTISVLPSFPWPAGAGVATNIIWYAAMTNPEMNSLFGDLGSFTFGWH